LVTPKSNNYIGNQFHAIKPLDKTGKKEKEIPEETLPYPGTKQLVPGDTGDRVVRTDLEA
jgi:hypothetical protein